MLGQVVDNSPSWHGRTFARRVTPAVPWWGMSEEENIRPWGRYDIIETGEGYQVKRIQVLPHARLSYQRHAHRAERWVIVRGTARVTLDDVQSLVSEGEVVHVATMMKHRIENPGDVPLLFIEVQLGSYLGEDDIERFADDYGRG